MLDPRMDPRFDLKQSRPWPPMYRNHPTSRGPSFCYRPVPLDAMAQWMTPHLPDYNYMPARLGGSNPNKGRDYYYLAPLYRNGIPPPQGISPLQMSPVAVSPRMMMMEAPRGRAKSSGGHCRSSVPPCTCSVGRTRSLEDVRSEVSEWEDFHDENGNHLQRKSPKNAASYRQVRRSMENLLDVESAEQREPSTFERVARSCRKPDDKKNDKSGKRRGSYMVRLGFLILTAGLRLRLCSFWSYSFEVMFVRVWSFVVLSSKLNSDALE